MIIDYTATYQNYSEVVIQGFHKTAYKCPDCNGKGFHKHGVYKRYYTVWTDGATQTVQMDILRIKCIECNKTHAVLARDMVPFHIYSLQLMAAILNMNFSYHYSLPEISSLTSISYQKLKDIQTWFQQNLDKITMLFESAEFWMESEIIDWESVLTKLQDKFLKENNRVLFENRRNSESYELRHFFSG